MDNDKRIKILEDKITHLEQRRVGQEMIIPTAIKTRHLGEGAPYIQSGTAANRPTSGNEPLQGSAVWFSTDTNVLSIWDGDSWVDFVFATGQTYTITNVTPDRSYDADATTTAELADTLGTLISDLRAVGLVE